MRWAGPRVLGKKERRGEDEGRERGESRAELASLARSLAYSLTGARPPSALRPALTASTVADRLARTQPGLPSAPVLRR